MIVLYDSIFGYIRTVVFQLIERIATNTLEIGICHEYKKRDKLGFSYTALSTRHEVPKVLHL